MDSPVWNYSSYDFTGSSNSTVAFTESNSVEETFKWTEAEIARLIQIIVRPIFLIIGTAGNGLTFYIMRKTSLKELSSCFYMSILAVADTSKYVIVKHHCLSLQLHRSCCSLSI